MDAFRLEMPLWEIVLRSTVVYIGLMAMIRFIPKRHTGELSPIDLFAMIIIGSFAADAILGGSTSILEIAIMTGIVLLLDYGLNLAEFHSARFRKMAQHSPTLLIYDGIIIPKNLHKEKLTHEELMASLRQNGIDEISQVRQAILEMDGRISVIAKE